MQDILLLHGAIGAMDQLQELETKLASSFRVHRLNFSGHGGNPFSGRPFSIALFAGEVIDYLDRHKIERIHIFGYSMGGYVGLYLAFHFPLRIHKIVTLATKFNWDVNIAVNEIKMLQADKIEEKLPAFAGSLQRRHEPNNWKTVLEKTAAMLFEMGKSNPLATGDFTNMHQPVLLMLGDRDKMVTLDETLGVYKLLPNAQLAVLPNTAHPIELVNMDKLAVELSSFIA